MSLEEIRGRAARFRASRGEIGQLCAELHERFGWTWDQIGTEVGAHLTTARRWAEPYLRRDDETNSP